MSLTDSFENFVVIENSLKDINVKIYDTTVLGDEKSLKEEALTHISLVPSQNSQEFFIDFSRYPDISTLNSGYRMEIIYSVTLKEELTNVHEIVNNAIFKSNSLKKEVLKKNKIQVDQNQYHIQIKSVWLDQLKSIFDIFKSPETSQEENNREKFMKEISM